ncbi:MAG: hypothetical protein ACF8Q5_09925 [Phycisphaerales bacterium JB040]
MTRIGHARRLVMAAGLGFGVLGGGWGGLGGVALAQEDFVPPEVAVTEHNAALIYFRAWLSMSSELDWTLEDEGDGYALAEGGREELLKSQPSIRALLKASRQSHADWGVEYEQGPHALLPSLGRMRYTSKVLAADALRCAGDGDASGAAERLGAIYRSGVHLSSQRVLISSLVGMAIANLGNRLTEQMLEAGQLDEGSARSLLRAMDSIDPSNPMRLRETVSGERDIVSDYIIAHCTGERAGELLRALASSMLGSIPEADENPLYAMNGAELRNDIAVFRTFYDDVLAVWDDEDASRKIAELGDRVGEGEYGHFAKLFAASFGRARQNAEAFEDEFTALRARLEALAEG